MGRLGVSLLPIFNYINMASTIRLTVTPTYDKMTLGLTDTSSYDVSPASATVDITPPGFDTVTLDFTPEMLNVFQSSDLGLVAVGETEVSLPDGVYTVVFTPLGETPITIYFMRIEYLQERFDAAFMKLDITECDKSLRKQAKVDLSTIYFFMQGSISAANNCAITESNTLYATASRLLTSFIKNNCGCSGTNFLINF